MFTASDVPYDMGLSYGIVFSLEFYFIPLV